MARGNNAGFKFNKESKAWEAYIDDFIEYYGGPETLTKDDIDEEYVEALLLMAINNGAEGNPDSSGNNGAAGGFGG